MKARSYSLVARRFLVAAAVILSACSDSTRPVTLGALRVTVTGLPSGSNPTISLRGPEGFSRTLSSSEVISGLLPGTYTLEASPVEEGELSYVSAPPSQTFEVVASGKTVIATVAYSLGPPSLQLDVRGLSFDVPGNVVITGPGGFTGRPGSSHLFQNLTLGTYSISAEQVTAGSVSLVGTPGVQQVTLRAGVRSRVTISYIDPQLNLTIAHMYVTQGVQTLDGTVPLVQGREGLVRVFVRSPHSSIARPTVRLRVVQGGSVVRTDVVDITEVPVDTSIRQGMLSANANFRLPGEFMNPGVSLVADVDPENWYGETSDTDNALGQTLDVRASPTFRVKFIPVYFTIAGANGIVSPANMNVLLQGAHRYWPLQSFDSEVGSEYTYSGDGEPQSVGRLLSELALKRTTEGSDRYYYGVYASAVGWTSDIGGIAYLGKPVALGVEGNGQVAAHEWGHNWGRLHAPCDVYGDPQYPHSGGRIGAFGFNFATNSIVDTSATDLMGYCRRNVWVSDYNYRAVQAFRAAEVAASPRLEMRSSEESVLLVWGRIVNGVAVLEPSFVVTGRPSLPTSNGAYTVEGVDAAGSRIFGFSFDAAVVADVPGDERHFTFAVPLSAEGAARLTRLRLDEGGRSIAVTTAPPVSSAASMSGNAAPLLSVQRLPRNGARLQWDATQYPAALIRDPATGEVLAVARGGDSRFVTGSSDVDVHLSNGVTSSSHRLKTPIY